MTRRHPEMRSDRADTDRADANARRRIEAMRAARGIAIAAVALTLVTVPMAAANAAMRAAVQAAADGGAAATTTPAERARRVALTIETRGGPRAFRVELARTPHEQERGLMYRTDLPDDGGMLFAPYPADGSGPREASFWMHNTPSALDILYIRRNGTIARIAANAEPFSETPIASGEPVVAVLEIPGGRAAALGIAVGDRVRWTIR